MFNFSEIKLVRESNDNFVGIRKSELGDTYEFHLPNGFDNFPDGDYAKVRNLFFKMYRTFRKFENDNKARVNLNRSDYQTDQDQTTVSSGGLSLQTEEGETCQLYSKLRMIERILETYDELVINSIQKKKKRTDDIDYSKIYKYLDRAIYLDNDVIFVDTMDLPRPVLRYESTDIVNLYCYILDEIIQQLEEDVPAYIKHRIQDIKILSDQFKDHYLTSDQSIFNEETFLETTNILKEALDTIDRYTYYKDADYWEIYEAIETFLYGELNPDLNDGEYWGIKGFSLIWEDMCHTYFFKNYHLEQICYADTDIPLKDYKNDYPKYSNQRREEKDINKVGNLPKTIYSPDKTCYWTKWLYSNESDQFDNQKLLRWHELLTIQIDPNSYVSVLTKKGYDRFPTHPDFQDLEKGNDSENKKRLTKYLAPDMVLINNSDNIEIIDFKDVPLEFYLKPSSSRSPTESNKYKNDIIKQLTYELALQQTHKISRNYFFIPYYYSNSSNYNHSMGEFEASLNVSDSGIQVFKADFFLIQNSYIEENL